MSQIISYICEQENRRDEVTAANTLNGIDYIEVANAAQTILKVFFLHPLPGQANGIPAAPPLTKSNIRIDGGTRIPAVGVTSVNAAGNVLTVNVSGPGDFSLYTLSLAKGSTDAGLPAGFDPRLSSIKFSFKTLCNSDFDCKQEKTCPEPTYETPDLDYMARDYDSFRRLMLDRLSLTLPEWPDRNPADPYIAVLESLAYKADQLSYYQDTVATEAYLNTARSRVSLRRHARLMDYFIDDGCNARTAACIKVEENSAADGAVLPKSTPVLTGPRDGVSAIKKIDYEKALEGKTCVFETMHDLTLHFAHNSISFYTWSDSGCCLPAGATSAALSNENGLSLKKGDLLVFQEILSPETGLAADADPARVHTVRLKSIFYTADPLDGTQIAEIEWFEEDALPFSFCLSAEILDTNGTPEMAQTSVAYGNVILADHGMSISGIALPPVEDAQKPYRPVLPYTGITFAAPYAQQEAENSAAYNALYPDNTAIPAIALNDSDEIWLAQRDLLASDRFSPDFVAETEHDGRVYLRFGDDIFGRNPSSGTQFTASVRIGSGSAGNIGANALNRVVTDITGINTVFNPLPAQGGRAPESRESIRRNVPEAFKTQQRAVTSSDYENVLLKRADIQRAAARIRWTGSWYTVFVTIDRMDGKPVENDVTFHDEILDYLERYRLAGYDLELQDPVYVSIDLAMDVCVKPNAYRSDVKSALIKTFHRFFDPDNFTFGQPIYLSRLYQAAMEVSGVQSVKITRFNRWGKTANNEMETGILPVSPQEIVRLANDPSFPEHGRLELKLCGGL